MSTLISSAVSGKKVAPKAPARRRAPAAAPNQQQPIAPAVTTASDEPTPQPTASPAIAQPQDHDQHPKEVESAAETSDHAPPPDLAPAPSPAAPPASSATSASATTRAVSGGTERDHDEYPSGTPATRSAAQQPPTGTPASEPQPSPPPPTSSKRRHEEVAEPVDSPAKKVKRSSTRSNAVATSDSVTDSIEDNTTDAPIGTGRTTRSGRSARTRDTQLPATPAATSGRATRAANHGSTTRSRRAARPAMSEATVEAGDEAGEGSENGGQAERSAAPRKRQARRRKPRTGDEAAPEEAEEDPEQHQIDPVSLLMFDLSRDGRHGQVSEREKRMNEIDWTEVAQKRREEIDRIKNGDLDAAAAQGQNGAEGAQGDTEAGAENNANAADASEQASAGGPQNRLRLLLVNDQIVADEDSLTIDRRAQVEAAATNDDVVEEDEELKKRVNRTTWINDRRREPTERLPMWRGKSDPWTEDDTERFYEALRMFGTDFFIISKMFPGRTRKHIKLKFVREERLDPVRINSALLGKDSRPMDLEHYARETNREVGLFTKYESFEQANESIKASMKEEEEKLQKAAVEAEEIARQTSIQRQQKEKQRILAEKKREERKANRRGRKKMGAGTFGG